MLPDPLFFIFIGSTIGFVCLRRERIAELFTSGINPGREVFDSDYLYIMLLTMLTYYPVSFVLSYLFGTGLIEINIIGLYIYFIVPTLLAGIVYTVVYAPVWYSTVEGGRASAVLGMLVAVMFGAFFSTYIVAGLNPDSASLRVVYGSYVDTALDILKLVSTMAILPVLQRFVEYAYTIFKNNFFVALRGATFAAVGGLVGIGTLMAIVPLFTSATVAGLFGGLLLRNNINNMVAPLVSLIAVLGVPPFWHTFYEFMAFGLIAASVGMLVYSLVIRKDHGLELSASGIVVGSMVLLFGAFNEVTISSSFAAVVKNTIVFTPVISDVVVDSNYIVAFILTWLVVLLVMLVVAYFIELVVEFVSEVVVP